MTHTFWNLPRLEAPPEHAWVAVLITSEPAELLPPLTAVLGKLLVLFTVLATRMWRVTCGYGMNLLLF